MAPPNYDQILAQWRLPGLNTAENDVAKTWLRLKGMNYDTIEFNVPLGPQPFAESNLTEEEKTWANFLYSSRADIVATQESAVTIIEVKKRATKGALGQLAHYSYWYRKAHPDVGQVVVRVIAEWADPGIAETLLAHGVDLELYGDQP